MPALHLYGYKSANRQRLALRKELRRRLPRGNDQQANDSAGARCRGLIAFPPFLSPVLINLADRSVQYTIGADLNRAPFTTTAILADGGIYDNLGLERVWKRCRTIFFSNTGRTIPEVGSPTGRWIGQMFRSLSLIQQQAEHYRRRILFGMANSGQRQVAYWSIDAASTHYAIPDAIPFASHEAAAAASLRTRLNPFSPAEQNLLLKAGYAGADASLRARGFAHNRPAASFDFPS